MTLSQAGHSVALFGSSPIVASPFRRINMKYMYAVVWFWFTMIVDDSGFLVILPFIGVLISIFWMVRLRKS